MEQIQQLLGILKDTPVMALWGLGLFLLFPFLKMASIVIALKSVITLGLKRFFDSKDTEIAKEESDKASEVRIEEDKNNVEREKVALEKSKLDFEISKEESSTARSIIRLFEREKISDIENSKLIDLLIAVKGDGNYIHEGDLDKAIEKLRRK